MNDVTRTSNPLFHGDPNTVVDALGLRSSKKLTLPDVLRNGRQHDPDGVEVVMSRQACEEAADEIESLQATNKCIRSWVPTVQDQIAQLTEFTSTELLPSQPPGWAGHYGGSSLLTAIHYLREYMKLRASHEPPVVRPKCPTCQQEAVPFGGAGYEFICGCSTATKCEGQS